MALVARRAAEIVALVARDFLTVTNLYENVKPQGGVAAGAHGSDARGFRDRLLLEPSLT